MPFLNYSTDIFDFFKNVLEIILKFFFKKTTGTGTFQNIVK